MGEIYGNPQATQTMLDDAFFNVEDWINSELAVEFSEQEEIAFTSGNGTKKPKGFLAYASTLDDDKTRAFGTLQHSFRCGGWCDCRCDYQTGLHPAQGTPQRC
jgi:HK97 family phage major capsid protein